MNTVQERLGIFVSKVLKNKKLNYREVSRRAGGAISHSAVGDIINGRVKDVRVETLQALAKGLGLPEEELLAVAFGKKEQPVKVQESRLLQYFRELSFEKQRIVVLIVEALANDGAMLQEVNSDLIGQKVEIIGVGEPNPKN